MPSHNKTIDIQGLGLTKDEPVHIDTLRRITALDASEQEDSNDSLHDELTKFSDTVSTLIKHHVFDSTRGFKSILISGDWGTGKTSVLGNLASKVIRAESGANHYPTKTIFFEAWKYENEQNLMFALLWLLVDSSEKGEEVKQEYNTDANSDIREVFDYLLAICSQKALNMSFKGMIEERNAMKAHRREKATTEFLPDYISTDRFLKGFESLLEKLYPEKKLVVLIDDLDRCSPESAMNLLDSIRQLINGVSDQNCCFVVAMDKVTLQQAIRHKFSELSSYDSNRYLEKLFPISLQLPAIQLSFDQFCKKGRAPNREAADAIDAIFQSPHFENARLFKRCMNQLWTYRLAQSTQAQRPKADGFLTENANVSLVLVEWLAAINRWPLLRQLISKGDSYWDSIQTTLEGRSDANLDDAETIAFLAQPGVKTFLIQSTVFGSIFSETNLYRRVQAYEAAERELRYVGL